MDVLGSGRIGEVAGVPFSLIRRRFAGRVVGRGQHGQQEPFMAGQPTGSDPIRGRGACYAFQAGTCRFLHL